MVNCLWTDNFFCRCYNTHRDQVSHAPCRCGDRSPTRAACAEIATSVAAYPEIVQVVRMRPCLVFDFKNDLVLVIRLLDEIDVVLRVSVAHQALDGRSRNAVGCGAMPVDVDPKIWRVMVVIRANTGEAFELLQLFHQLIGDGIDILRYDAANRIGVLSLGLTRGTDTDLQDWAGR